jgi:hypothetical protein
VRFLINFIADLFWAAAEYVGRAIDGGGDDPRPCKGRNSNVCVGEGCYGEACIRGDR